MKLNILRNGIFLFASFTLLIGINAMELQLNCSSNPSICPSVCNEPKPGLPYSGTFCDNHSGSCVCDCRTELKPACEEVPFTPCFQDCVRKNPNPDVYLYKGGNCPVTNSKGRTDHQCACECSLRDDYIETNDVF